MTTKTAEPVTQEMLVPAVGALIFASDEPVKPKEIATSLGGVDLDSIEQAIQTLQDEYERNGAGLRLERIAGGVRLATRPEVGAWVRRFFQQQNRTRLSPAALETLAIVAYRQPVTAPEIQAIRGKDPQAAVKSLLDKRMIRILGKKKVVGNPLLYGTSKEFLVHFGLNSLGDLPSIEDFDEFVDVLEAGQAKLFAESDESEAEAPPEGEVEASGDSAEADDVTATEDGEVDPLEAPSPEERDH